MGQQPAKGRNTLMALGFAIAIGVGAGLGVSRPDLRTSATRPPEDQAVKPVKFDAADPPANLPERVDPRLLVPGARWYLSSLQEFAWKPGAPGWTLGKGGWLGDPAARRMIHFHAEPTASSLSMHPPDHGYTRVCYYLRQQARVLLGKTCLSDDDPNETPEPTRFLVLGDGKLLWECVHRSTTTTASLDLDVSEVNVLELRAHVESGNSAGSHAVWLQPYVLTKGQAKSQKRPPSSR